jgi:glutathione S-transferase
VLGERFSAADVAATLHFPLVRTVGRKVLDFDPLAEVPGLLQYLERMEQRPTVQRIRKDQAADGPAFIAHIQSTPH